MSYTFESVFPVNINTWITSVCGRVKSVPLTARTLITTRNICTKLFTRVQSLITFVYIYKKIRHNVFVKKIYSTFYRYYKG